MVEIPVNIQARWSFPADCHELVQEENGSLNYLLIIIYTGTIMLIDKKVRSAKQALCKTGVFNPLQTHYTVLDLIIWEYMNETGGWVSRMSPKIVLWWKASKMKEKQ